MSMRDSLVLKNLTQRASRRVKRPSVARVMTCAARSGGLWGEAPGKQVGLGGRRPPNDQCDKGWVRVYVPVTLLNVWVTKIFLCLG